MNTWHIIILICVVEITSCGNFKGLETGSLDVTSCSKVDGYFCDTSGKLQALIPGVCAQDSDCPSPYSCNTVNNQCYLKAATNNQEKYWFATDPIRPGVTSTCNDSNGSTTCPTVNQNDYIYNIMAKGYASLDDWCMNQAQQSTDPNVRNIGKWKALILANGTAMGFSISNGFPASSKTASDSTQLVTGCGGLGTDTNNQYPCPFLVNRLALAFTGTPGENVSQVSQNRYLSPMEKGCVDGICDKNGGSINTDYAPQINDQRRHVQNSVAWFGYQNRTTISQSNGSLNCDPSGTDGFSSQNPGCLARRNNPTNEQWVAGVISQKFWSIYSIQSDQAGFTSGGASLYVAKGSLSTTVAAIEIDGLNNSDADPGLTKTNPYPTAVTNQNRVLCLSANGE